MIWRLVWRDARRRPGFWLAAVLTLTLGLGSVTAIFSLIDSILLRPLPFPDGDRLVGIRMESGKLRGALRQNSLPDFEDWRRSQSVFSSMGLAEQERLTILWDGRAQPVSLSRVTPDYFTTLGASAAYGRTFLPEEDQPGADARKILLGHDFWRNTLGGDQAIVGRTLRTGYGTVTVVGIMPPGFAYPNSVQAWMPVQARLDLRKVKRTDERTFRNQQVIARLREGVSIEQAAQQMRALSLELERRYPVTNEAMRAVLSPLQEIEVGSMRRYLAVLMAAVALLLTIAVVNVANLLLVRVAGRFAEFTLRSALGAPSRALVTGPLSESLVVALGGWLCGLGVAYLFVTRFADFVPIELPTYVRIELSLLSVGVTLLIALDCASISCLLPTRVAQNTNAAEVLRESGRGVAGRQRWHSWLVAGELALAFALLVAAGLLVKSFQALEQVDHGFEAQRVMTLQVSPNVPGENDERIRRSTQLVERIERRLLRIPGVEAVGGTDTFPFTGHLTERRTRVMEARADASERQHRAPSLLIDVSPGYFRALKIPLLEGREFREDEDLTKPWTIILSRRAAKALFPDRPALGQQVRTNTIGAVDPWATVVGVVDDVKYRADESEQSLEFYYPAKQYGMSQTRLAVRFNRELRPQDATAVREAVVQENPETPVEDVRTLTSVVAQTLWQPRLWSRLLAAFAVLSAVGLYGMLSYGVEQRRSEIGVRLALGSTPAGIAWWMTRQGLRTVSLGLAAGFVLALACGRLLQSLLFRVEWWDPSVYLTALVAAVVIGIAASQVPALRAARIDPLVALRDA
jgi:putative ABC transport system permease protein